MNPGGNPRSLKPKRVSDVNAVPSSTSPGPAQFHSPYDTNSPAFGMPSPQPPQNMTNPNYTMPMSSPNYYSPGQPQQPQQQQQPNYPQYGQYGPPPGEQRSQFNQGPNPQGPQGPNQSGFPQQFAMFQQPLVQDMAMQYGQKLADQGKELVNKEFEKYVPVTKLKYYFAVDNSYVINKLRLLFFPFTHRDWSLKYNEETPVQPRYDINAPDLYIPTMGYITYVVLAGLILGMQNRFTPEQLGIQASSALAYIIFELIIYTVTLYVANITTTLKTLDLLAFSGYKFATICGILLISLLFGKSGYYICLIYSSATLAFFLLRTLKVKVLSEPVQTAAAPQIPSGYDSYGQPIHHFDHTLGRKRKLYFLFLVAGLQPVLSWWLTMHLEPIYDVLSS
jgi:hypothetical protein